MLNFVYFYYILIQLYIQVYIYILGFLQETAVK